MQRRQEEFTGVMNQHQDDIIDCCGGLPNMVRLCLLWNKLNPHIENNIDEDRLSKLMSMNGITIDMDGTTPFKKSDLPSDYNHTNYDDENFFSQIIDPKSHSNGNVTDSIQIIADNNMNMNNNNNTGCVGISISGVPNTIASSSIPSQSQSTITCNIKEYHKSKIVIQSEKRNNLCFKWLSQSNLIEASTLSRIIYSKFYTVTIFGTAILCRTLSEIIASMEWMENYVFVASCLHLFGAFLFIIYWLSLALISNINVIRLIINTFDFWFKIISVTSTLVAVEILIDGTHDFPLHVVPTVIRIVGHVSLLCIVLILCTYDALSISFKIKFRFSVIVAMYIVIWVVYGYFILKDVIWNPFDINHFKYSQISFKSTFISSSLNLALFVVKPYVRQLTMYLTKQGRRVCKLCVHGNYDYENEKNKCGSTAALQDFSEYDRCNSVYK